MNAEYAAYLKTAVRAAKRAGQLQQSYLGRDLGIDTKSNEIDLVTKVDRESEALIRKILLAAYPEHTILGEEQGQQEQGGSSFRWIVDPIDGTLNYAHGLPVYCVCVALEMAGEVVVGVVYDPAHDDLFTATKGGGAWRNGAPMAVSEEAELRRSMIATGFAYDVDEAMANVHYFGVMMPKCRALRRLGSAGIDLAYVAAGLFDGFWEMKLNPWDVAAGMLLVTEAGGKLTDGAGRPYRLGDSLMVCSNGVLHEALLAGLELSEEHQRRA